MSQINNSKKVAIIGGGISGISAAMELIDKDINIDIYEARNSIGGRVAGIKDKLTGDEIDNGKHLMVGAYSNFFDLLKKLGTFKHLYFQKYFNVNFISESGEFNFSNGRFGKLSQLISLMNFPGISLRDKRNSINFINQVNRGLDATPSESAKDILNNFQISNKISEILWEPLILATMNTTLREASGKIFLNILKLAFFHSNYSGRLVFSNLQLNKLLIPFLTIFPNEHRRIFLQKSIESVNKIDDDNFIIKIKNGEEYNYNAVIFTLTPFALKKIKTNFQMPDFESFESSPIVSLYLWSEEDFLKNDFYALIGAKFHWIFKETYNSLRYAFTHSAADEFAMLSKSEIIELAYQDLEKLFPKFNRNLIYQSQLIIEKKATIKLTPQTELLRPAQKISKGIYLAGDWTSTGLPATMESAALSGKHAVGNLITDLSL
ncbi:MAG: FAD-dependent oxidoreductase [Chloroherpetonaceae bacterium]